MAKKGIRLFKIASQINVGKDTIVSYLQSKGFSVENKPTFSLDEDMLAAVDEHFKRERAAAEKLEEKTEAYRKARQTPEEQAEAALGQQTDKPVEAATDKGKEAPKETATEVKAPQPELSSPEKKIPEPQQEPEKVASPVEAQKAPETPQETKDDSAPVGTVIDLKEFGGKGGRKRDAKKAVESTKPEAKTPLKGKSAEKAAEPTLEKTAESKVKPEPKAEESKPVPQKKEAEISAKAEDDKKARAEAAPAEVTDKQPLTAEKPQEQQKAPKEPPATIAAETEEAEEAEAEALHEEEALSDHDTSVAEEEDYDEEEDTRNRKKRRKKKIAEIEYQTGDSPQLKGLTILGKIDLVSKPKKKDIRKRRKKKETDSESTPTAELAKPVKKTPLKAKTGLRNAGPTPPTPFSSDDQAVSSEAGKGKKRRKKGKKPSVNAEDVDKAIRETLTGKGDSLSNRSKMRQRRRQERAEEQERQRELAEQEKFVLTVTEFVTVSELANLMNKPVNELILQCMNLGLMVSINQRLERDTITLIADEYGYSVEFEEEFSDDSIADEDDPEETLHPRAPIVTIMGHVDHGKTSLLDYIRSENVVAGEAGGITQHIGAYSVHIGENRDKSLTFLDTPGHQAFTAMRARGAQVTDLVVLIVAADDSVMPQTVEAISHARAASVPIVVAINKVDRPDSNPDRIRQQLADHDLLVEDWGGKYQVAEISAKTGQGIENLLEKILLEAELLEIRANPDRLARGTIIESKIDKGKGAVATVIIQKGTLKVGDPFICGVYSGRVRAMLDERGKRVKQAPPSSPVQVLGFDGAPNAGDQFVVVDNETEAKQLASKRQQIKREQAFKQIRHITLDDIANQIKSGGIQDLPIILKADADGSVEALTDALHKISTDEVRVSVIHKGVGAIAESDIMLAAASNAIVIGFHIRPTPQARKLAEAEGVDVRIYRIIYDCINEVKSALEGMLRPEVREEISGMVEVRDIFKISKVGTIAGCYVSEGKINRNDHVRLVRDGFEVFEGKIQSLKRHKDDTREVDTGYECGIGLAGFNDIKVGDVIEAVKTIEIKRTLEKSGS